MKAIFALLIMLVSMTGFGSSTNPECVCETTKTGQKMEVRFEDGVLSYDNGRFIEVAVASTTNDEKIFKVSGLSKGIVFAGGGRQSVSLKVDLKSRKGSISIYTKTFYRNHEETQDLNCTF